MSQKLNARAFFFNAKTDYLPYYKNFTLAVEDEACAKDILGLIQEQNSDFSYPNQKLIMKINGLVVEAKEPMTKIIERLGTDLLIEPVSSYRSNNGLKINDDDFMQSYDLLEPYATESYLKYYKTLYALHYASETENFDREYIGDAILVLAHKMIKEGSEHKKAILNTITSVHSGLMDCEYENNLFEKNNYAETINTLKAMTNSTEENHPSLLDMIKNRFCKERGEKVVTKPTRTQKNIEALKEKHIAYNAGNTNDNVKIISQMILDIGASEVTTTRQKKLSGVSILTSNKTLALKKAGTTLLDAYDSGAELLLIEDEATYKMMTKYFSKIENIMGRKMGGLELQLAEDFVAQASALTA